MSEISKEFSSGPVKSVSSNEDVGMPKTAAASVTLDHHVETARGNAQDITAENTSKAYRSDWVHFGRWCQRRGAIALPPSPELIGHYLLNCAAPDDGSPALSASTIERRLCGLAWQYQQRGHLFDRKDRLIAAALAEIRRKATHGPLQKEAMSAKDIRAMVATLGFDLRGIRDRAMLLIGYAAGLRRTEIVSLDFGRDDARCTGGWVEIEEAGATLFLRRKTGLREVDIGRGPSDLTCPIHALEQWLHFAEIDFGPLFRRTSRDNTRVLEARLSDKHVARLIKQTVLEAGLRSDLPEQERLALFSGNSLRTGLAFVDKSKRSR